eukprot:scaffold2736_cov82-Skeletonema_dohrnii-CCMP3373.AAC.5
MRCWTISSTYPSQELVINGSCVSKKILDKSAGITENEWGTFAPASALLIGRALRQGTNVGGRGYIHNSELRSTVHVVAFSNAKGEATSVIWTRGCWIF